MKMLRMFLAWVAAVVAVGLIALGGKQPGPLLRWNINDRYPLVYSYDMWGGLQNVGSITQISPYEMAPGMIAAQSSSNSFMQLDWNGSTWYRVWFPTNDVQGYLGAWTNTVAPIASPTFTGTVTLPSGTALASPTISAPTLTGVVTSTNLAGTYAPIASPTFTGTVTLPSTGATFANGTVQQTAFPLTPIYKSVLGQTYGPNNTALTYNAVVTRYRITNNTAYPLYGVSLKIPFWGSYSGTTSSGGENYITSQTSPFETAFSLIYPAGSTNGVYFTKTDGSELFQVAPPVMLETTRLEYYIPAGGVFEVMAAANRIAVTNGAGNIVGITGRGTRTTLGIDGNQYLACTPGVSYWSGNGTNISEDSQYWLSGYTGTGSNLWTVIHPYMTGQTRTLSKQFTSSNPTLRPVVIGYFNDLAARSNSVAVIGDSITTANLTEPSATDTVISWPVRTFAANGVAVWGQAGELFADWVDPYQNNSVLRASALQDAGIIVIAHGRNDLTTNTLAQMQSICIQSITRASKYGARIYVTDLLPAATSGDATGLPLTETNQTALYGTVRVPYNAWINAGLPMVVSNGLYYAATNGQAGAIYAGPKHPLNLRDYLPIASSCESTNNPGCWKAIATPQVWTGTLTTGTTTLLAYQTNATWPNAIWGTGSYAGLVFYNSTRSLTSQINNSGSFNALNGTNWVTLKTAVTGQTVGDTAYIYDVYSWDMTHPATRGVKAIVAAVQAKLGTNSMGAITFPSN